MTGENIHGYTLLGLLGTGTFGEVWEAKAPGGFRAAVKIIYKRGSQAEARLELQALEILKGLDHLHLLKTYACWVEDYRVIIAMELADGTLRNRLMYCQKQGQRGIPPDELLHYLREAAEALDYLHARGMFHRDVKPDNILLFTGSNPPHVKLGDCGLLREQGESFKEMTTAGTPPYIAPEVWKKTTLPQSDQYSLAVTFVELRTGNRPIDADNPLAMAMAHSLDVPNLEGLTEGEKQVIGRALSKEPAARFPTCVDMADALERALNLSGRFRTLEPVRLSQGNFADRARDEPKPVANDPDRPTHRDSLASASLWHTPGSMTDPQMPAGTGDWKVQPSEQPAGHWLGISIGIAVALVAFVLVAGVSWYLIRKPDRPPGPGPVSEVQVTGPTAIWLAAGSKREILFPVKPPGRAEMIQVLLPDGDGLTFRPEPRSDGMVVTVQAASEVAPGVRRVNYRMKATSNEVNLKAEDAAVEVHLLPAGFRAESDQPEGEPAYFSRIARRIGDDDVAFRLVRPGNRKPPFYLMENKVWNSLFAQFARLEPAVLAGSLWQKGGRADGRDTGNTGAAATLPVLRVRRDEAANFARWLGGQLPSAAHLDVAGGDRPVVVSRAALNRRREGPRAVHNATNDDVSTAGIRDLGGNGWEWTRDDIKDESGTTLAVLRGRSYTFGPLSVEQAREQREDRRLTPTQFPDIASAYTGFRVVIEVVDGR